MDLKDIRESALRAALIATSAILTTSFFTGCGNTSQNTNTQPTTTPVKTETETLAQPVKRSEFEKVALSTYINDRVKVDNLSVYTKFYDTGEVLGSTAIGDTMKLYQGTEDTMYAGLNKDGVVLGYTEDPNSVKVNGAETYVQEKYSNLTYAVMNGSSHNYWFTGAEAVENQRADALSGRYGDLNMASNVQKAYLYRPFSDPVTVLQAEGSKVALNVYTDTAIEVFTKRWEAAREKAKEKSGLLVNDKFYEYSIKEQDNKIYVDLMSLGESLDMTYSNASFEHVIKAFGTSEEDVEFVSVIHNSDWGFGMHFVKFQEGSTEVNDRVFVEYYTAGETYLKELDLGKFQQNEGELLIVPNAEAPLMYVNVQALEQVLGLNGVVSKNDAGYVLEITQGDLKPKHVVIDEEQYTTVVCREEFADEAADDYTKWDASTMSYAEAKEKLLADGKMSTEESLWLMTNYKEELAQGFTEKDESGKDEATPEQETIVTKPVEQETASQPTITQPEQETTTQPEEETTVTPVEQETTTQPTTQAPTGGTMTAEQQNAASADYNVNPDRDSYGPGVNKTATSSGFTGEAGRIIEWTDSRGAVLTAVTSGEVIYDPASRCFYDVVTPLTYNGVDVEIASQGTIDKTANYFITARGSLGDLRSNALRAH